MCQKTFQEFPTKESFDKKADLADDYFGLIARFFRFLPSGILNSKNLVRFIFKIATTT